MFLGDGSTIYWRQHDIIPTTFMFDYFTLVVPIPQTKNHSHTSKKSAKSFHIAKAPECITGWPTNNLYTSIEYLTQDTQSRTSNFFFLVGVFFVWRLESINIASREVFASSIFMAVANCWHFVLFMFGTAGCDLLACSSISV